MEENRTRQLTVGILAHVDAGKTTLSESLLHLCGSIRKVGRVDHGDTFLDTHPLERERGITIFSKQARMRYADLDVVLLDTPGHVDFSAETERTLSVLDYAILVISATDGVQNHTLTLWQLLRTYRVPVFLFVNKTDLPSPTPLAIEESLKARLDSACCAFLPGDEPRARNERIATSCEALLDPFLENGTLSDGEIAAAVADRRLFPCFFGSALHEAGVKELLDALADLTLSPEYPDGFDTRTGTYRKGAKVYKIGRDGNLRLTWLKVTSGTLSVRDEIAYVGEDGKTYHEKIAQIRLYSGERFTTVERCRAGGICTVTGLSATYAGMGIGEEPDSERPVLEPVMTYRLTFPEGCDVDLMYPKLKQLEEEDPALHLTWEDHLREIHVGLMGDVQIDVLKRTVAERFGVEIGVDAGHILYKETLSGSAEGVGHFEPLRHYAEVHLLLEPLPPGSGLLFGSRCPESVLERNWQRLILSNLGDKTHRGVLTGAPITDMKITLLTGRAHVKHTEGGDFREATWRAVRQGLMQVPSVLLEPWYRYVLEVPEECCGRAMADVQAFAGTFTLEEIAAGVARLSGHVPVAGFNGYAREVAAYTHGQGRLFCTPEGYRPCHNAEEVIAAAGYDPVADLENTPDSVFCAHGAGFVVPWDRVRDYMHLDSGYNARGKRTGRKTADTLSDTLSDAEESAPLRSAKSLAKAYRLSDEELEAIMLREFGPMKRRRYSEPKTVSDVPTAKKSKKPPVRRPPLLIVDGYNLIFQWEYFADLAGESLEKAREVLMDTLASYVGYTKCDLVLVFDAYRVKDAPQDGNNGKTGARETERDGYRVVFTAENQTADAYIEKMVHDLGPDYSIRVVTSDALIQSAAVTSGVLRMSSREFVAEVEKISAEITEFIRKLE